MREPWQKAGLVAALLAVALGGLLVPSAEAKGKGVFATRIAAAGPIALSCDTKGRLADRVSLDVLIGYSDLREGLERRLGRKGSGEVRIALKAAGGRVLARELDRERVRLGGPENRVHHTQELVLGKDASARVLRYAHGATACSAKPRRSRVVKVSIQAKQRLGGAARVARDDGAASPVAALQGSGEVLGLPGAQTTSCAPYPCYQKAAEVLAWNKGQVRAIDVADVPLADRVPVPGPRFMTGFDNGAWAYWSGSDLNSQGSAQTGNVFNFSQWQYVDTLYYYSHNLLSVPPTVWVNAAHRNGVSILASVTGDCDECGPELNELFEKHQADAVDRLYDLAAAYGFDGWMIDIEREAQYSPELLAAMRELRARKLPNGRQVQVVTYEAFQTSLNEDLLDPFLAAGEWQADYDHAGKSSYPQETYDFLAEQKPPLTDRRYDTYWATDVYRFYEKPAQACGERSSADYVWNGFRCSYVKELFANLGSARVAADPPGFLQSMALYAPGWTAFGGRKEPSQQPAPRAVSQAADSRFWPGVGGYRESGGSCQLAIPSQNSVSALLTPRSTLTRVPFATNFNTGEGDVFTVQGKVVGKQWNLLSAQDATPTGFCSQTPELGAAIDYGNSYDGGSSLEVAGRTSGDARRVYLYEASAPLPSQPAFLLRYARAGSEPQVTVWIDNRGPYDLAPSVKRPEGVWMFSEASLPAGVAGTLTRIGVSFAPNSTVKATIGELAIVNRGASPPSQISPTFSFGELTWTDPSAASTRYYNVWAQPRGASCSVLLGRTTLRRYYPTQSLFPVPPEVASFRVQPVSTSGLAAPLSPPPC